MTAEENLRAATEKLLSARVQLDAISLGLTAELVAGHSPNRVRATIARVAELAKSIHETMEFIGAYVKALYSEQDNAATAKRNSA